MIENSFIKHSIYLPNSNYFINDGNVIDPLMQLAMQNVVWHHKGLVIVVRALK